ncbi:MAG: ABC-three component system middle component 6 [Rickettsiales bacterium]|nr:ABC-three component system middle component 6 [Rickettsiales bacterium]
MILPNKYLREHETLIGVGSLLLKHLTVEKTLSSLWDEVKSASNIGNFERFVLGLDLLFLLGLVETKSDKIARVAA